MYNVYMLLHKEDIEYYRLERITWYLTKGYVQKNRTTGCLEWLRSKNKLGYGSIRVNGKTHFAHRVAYIIFKGDIPEGMCVCHACDVPYCVNPDHLWIGTHKQNSQDMVNKNRCCRKYHGGGFKKGHIYSRNKRKRKLTDTQVREIRATLYAREPLSSVADRYGVTVSCISTIRRGKRKTLVT
jgi:HNH endonuclease